MEPHVSADALHCSRPDRTGVVEVGRYLWSNPLLKQGYQEPVGLGRSQTAFECCKCSLLRCAQTSLSCPLQTFKIGKQELNKALSMEVH